MSHHAIRRLKRSHQMRSSRRTIDGARDLYQSLKWLKEDTGRTRWLGMGLFGLSTIAKWTDVNIEKDRRFREVEFDPFGECLYRMCENSPRFEQIDGNYLAMMDMWGVPILFESWGRKTYCIVDPDAPKNHVEQAFHGAGRVFWEGCGSHIELLFNNESSAELKAWDGPEPLWSEQGERIVDRIQDFAGAGYRRSILLHGDPGTGKSCMARFVCENLGLTTLFIDAAQVEKVDLFTLWSCFKILNPEVVIIDDIDRVKENVPLLISLIDRIAKNTRLFFATANDIDKLSRALVRTGRFDEIRLIDGVVVKPNLDWLPQDYHTRVEDWPASFLDELRRCVSIYGVDVIEEELSILEPRVERNFIPESGESDIEALMDA